MTDQLNIDLEISAIEFKYDGTYTISYSAIGGLVSSIAPVTPATGNWSLGLYLNNVYQQPMLL